MVLLDDISPIAHKVNIKTEQKNVIPVPYRDREKTLSGIRFTFNDDWSISLNGTWSGGTAAAVADLYLMSNYQLPTGTYVLSGGNDGGGTYKYRLFGQLIRADGSPLYISLTDSKTATAFTVNEGDLFSLSIRIGNEIGTVKDFTFYPMLERGAVASHYTPPVDLSLTQIDVKGKNLFNDTYFYNNHEFVYDGQKNAWLGNTLTETIFYNYAGAHGSFTIQCEAMNTAADKKSICFLVHYTDGTQKNLIGSAVDSNGIKLVSAQTDATKTVEKIDWSYSNIGSFYVRNTMISYAPTVSEYEPFVEYHTAMMVDENNTLTIDAHYPSMTIYNTLNGAVIDVEYNRDLNKAFAELYNAIISTGGNV